MQGTQAAAVKGIRIHLAGKNRSQAWLARQMGESSFWIGRRMTGAVTFDVEDLDRVADALGTDLPSLLEASTAIDKKKSAA